MINAWVDTDMLFVSGQSAETENNRRVAITHLTTQLTIKDNDVGQSPISVTGDESSVQHINARSLKGSGVTIFTALNSAVELVGSMQGDSIHILSGNSTGNKIRGLAGNDDLNGNDGNDRLFGGSGNDSISAGGGNDRILAGTGKDIIDGGTGNDTLIVRGISSDHIITEVSGRYQISKIGENPDKSDIFANIEAVRFSDKIVQITSAPTNMTATVDGNWLILSGDAYKAGSSSRVRVTQQFSDIEVEDNDTIRTIIPVNGDSDQVHHIDASGLKGSGVWIYSSYVGSSELIGSRQDDHIVLYSEASSLGILRGMQGNDDLTGDKGDNRLYGGRGNDTISGSEGNDRIFGGKGNNLIDGGSGTDTLIIRGVSTDYQMLQSNGRYEISSIASPLAETNIIANIERIKFTDQSISVSSIPANLEGTINGNWLHLFGQAANILSSMKVRITQISTNVTVEDNDTVQTTIPLGDPAVDVRHFDASGLMGAGIYIFASYTGRSEVIGSHQDDYLYCHGDGNDILRGLQGSDRLLGNAGDDRLFGGRGSDTIEAGSGNDRIIGGQDNDVLSGGSGADRFIFFSRDGHDTIMDFESRTDIIVVREGASGFVDLSIQHTDSGALVIFAETSIQMSNVAADLLTADHFEFA